LNKWVCAAMKQIFTKEELKEGYVCGEKIQHQITSR
jgi:hypothetical protein